jgi:ribosomal protein S6--L-glutamate ligase
VRIAFLVQASKADPHGPGLTRVTAETLARLRERGAQVDVLVAGAQVLDLAALTSPQHDLYVLKSKAPLTHSLAGALEVAGATVVNTFTASTLTWDKIATTWVLSAAGVPVPASWATGRAEAVRPLLTTGPLWIKPQHGKSGSGVHRVTQAAALDASIEGLDPYGFPLPLFAQRDVPSGGLDFKVYVIGDRMWSMTKPWPPRVPGDKSGTAVPLPPAIREAALTAGRTLGLELYGVDFLLPPDAPDEFVVVDVNAFPGYNGLAEAPGALADYLYQRARSQ